jgi:hypothetical protein
LFGALYVYLCIYGQSFADVSVIPVLNYPRNLTGIPRRKAGLSINDQWAKSNQTDAKLLTSEIDVS